MALEKKFYLSGSTDGVKNMGSAVPKWAGNYNLSNWWYDGQTTTDYFYAINADDIYIQYGQDINLWATSKFFGQSVKIESEVENEDGSITVTFSTTPNFFASRQTSYTAATGVSVKWTVKINNTTVYTYSGLTNAEFTNGKGTTQKFTVTIAPQQTYTGSAMTLEVTYPNGEFKDSKVTTGISLYNSNPISFRPWAARKNSTFRSLDRDSGFLMRRVAGKWKDIPKMSYDDQGKANKGSSQIRKSGTWVGQSKIGS